ncbi:MAG: hypothetical protein LBF19_02195 [Prevotellaceae bacterium]|nr:hypothetical protein [Prevotellaceae bacterium]
MMYHFFIRYYERLCSSRDVALLRRPCVCARYNAGYSIYGYPISDTDLFCSLFSISGLRECLYAAAASFFHSIEGIWKRCMKSFGKMVFAMARSCFPAEFAII